MFNEKLFLPPNHPQQSDCKNMWGQAKQSLCLGILGLSLILGGTVNGLAANVTVTFDAPMTFNTDPITFPNVTPDPNYDPTVFDPNSFNPLMFDPNFLTTEGFVFTPQATGSLPHYILVDNPTDLPCTLNATGQNFGGCVDNGTNYLAEEAGPGAPGFALGVPIIMTDSSSRPFSLLGFDGAQLLVDAATAAGEGFPNADQIDVEGELFNGGTLQLSFPLKDVSEGFSTFSLPLNWVNLKAVTFSGSVLDQNGEKIGTGAIAVDNLSALTNVLITERDSILSGWRHLKNRNEGANSSLVVRWLGKRRTVVGFDLNGISAEGLEKVTLVLNLKREARYWGRRGGKVNVHNLSQSFTEGNGARFGMPRQSRDRGNGSGVTWNCATDTEIGNRRADCEDRWNGASDEADFRPTDSVKHKNGMTGEVRFDVTPDVLNMLGQEDTKIQWLVRKAKEYRWGVAEYYSKEGAGEAGDIMKAPRLELEYTD